MLTGSEYLGPVDGLLPYGRRVTDFIPGTKFILIFGNSFDDRDVVSVGTGECGVIEDSDQNLAAIQRGIRRDALADAQ